MNDSRATEIRSRIEKVIASSLSIEMDQAQLSSVDRLEEVIGLDSLTMLELVAALEAEFGITIEADKLEMEMLNDLPKLTAYLSERMGA